MFFEFQKNQYILSGNPHLTSGPLPLQSVRGFSFLNKRYPLKSDLYRFRLKFYDPNQPDSRAGGISGLPAANRNRAEILSRRQPKKSNKIDITKDFPNEESSLPLSIGYDLTTDTAFDTADSESGFSEGLEDLNNKIIMEYIKAEIRNEILKKLHNAIANIDQECKEEEFKSVSDQAKENAGQILNAVYTKFPQHEYYIHPTEDREIALDCNPQRGKGVLILCDSKGGVAYFSTWEGRNSRFRCDCITDFPYEHLWKIFKRFDKEILRLPTCSDSSSSTSQNKTPPVLFETS